MHGSKHLAELGEVARKRRFEPDLCWVAIVAKAPVWRRGNTTLNRVRRQAGEDLNRITAAKKGRVPRGERPTTLSPTLFVLMWHFCVIRHFERPSAKCV